MICNECKDRSCEKTGKPCREIEEMLNSEGIRGRNWIRPRRKDSKGTTKWIEIPFSSLNKEGRKIVREAEDNILPSE